MQFPPPTDQHLHGQGWLIGVCLVFACSPFLMWLFSPPDGSQPTQAAGSTAQEADTPPTSGTNPATSARVGAGATARFGRETTPSTVLSSSVPPSSGTPSSETPSSEAPSSEAPSSTTPPSTAAAEQIPPTTERPTLNHPLTTVFGTGSCHESYSDCVPVAEDVDCVDSGSSGGTDGDGPVFVEGPLVVTGDDVYGLDPNGDKVACFDGDS